MIEFTPNQRAAIERIEGTVFVSAAAGSGKTAVLVERIVEIVCNETNRVDADRLLVVTFTKAAAAEMTARVKSRIDQKLLENPKSEWLRRQSLLIRRATISTVHAFCMSLLREFWSELGLPPDFTIAGELFLEEMRETVLAKAAERLYEDKEGRFRAFSDLFGRARSDREALETVDRFDRFLSDLSDPESWKNDCLSSFTLPDSPANTTYGRKMFQFAKEAVEAAGLMLKRAWDLAQSDDGLAAAYGEAIQDDLYTVNALESRIKSRDWDGTINLIESYEPLRLKPAKGADPQLKEQAKQERDRAKTILKELEKRYFLLSSEEFRLDNILTARAMETLFWAVDVFQEEYQKQKQRRKMLDYGDLEHLAIRLLEQDSLVREEILSRYEYIFVDEYQDTNEIQDRLFTLLSERSGKFFGVGDIKQSIYRFRRADPEIFIEKRKQAFSIEENRYPAHIPLTHNFRSGAPVIEAVNRIFSAVMTERVGDVDYKGKEELTSPKIRTEGEEPGLEVLLANSNFITDETEAEQVAEQIARLLNQGYLIEEESKGKKVSRPCRPGDFAILLRAKTKAPMFEESLRKRNIPVNGDGAGALFERSETEVLIALLSVIDNPKRDVDMAAAMLSPLFDFTPDDLLRLKQPDRYRDLYSAILGSKDERFVRFSDRLSDWRKRAANQPVDQLLTDIVDETDAEYFLTAGENSSKRIDSIRILIDNAAQLSRFPGLTLSRFLRLIRRGKQPGDALSGGFTPSKDAVNILTVHKSKGLEWPIVIVADAAKGFNYTDVRLPSVLFDRKMGAGIRYRTEIDGKDSLLAVRNTVPFKAIAAYQEQKMISEECRVLYVALTRAKQKIFVSASVKDIEKALPEIAVDGSLSDYTVGNAKNFLSWVLLGLREQRETVLEALVNGQNYSDGVISIGISARDANEILEEKKDSALDQEAVEVIKRQIAYRYPRSGLFDVPTKLSVSELTHDRRIQPGAPAFMSGDGLGAAARGTAIHQFMQFADYLKARDSVEEELARLVEKGFVSKEYAEIIDLSRLRAFFESDLARRLIENEVLREYAFIDAMDAGGIKELPKELSKEKVMVQGIVDCILFEGGGAILVDYKSDVVKDKAELIRRYQGQLAFYKKAVEARFRVPVTESVIYSFHLNETISLEE